MPQRVADHLAAVQGPHRGEEMGRVGALAAPRVDEVAAAAPREQRLEEQRLRRPGEQAAATCPADRGSDPGIREF
jgi:hypothetical protein